MSALKHEQIRWTDQNNLHITLMFLGDTDKNQVQTITRKLEGIADQYSPFQFQLNGIAYFTRNRHPSIIYSGTENTGTLKSLSLDIKKEMTLPGFEKQQKSFTPHLTLGRIKYLSDTDKLNGIHNVYRDTFIQSVQVDQFIYYQSILTPNGAKYQPIKTFNLK